MYIRYVFKTFLSCHLKYNLHFNYYHLEWPWSIYLSKAAKTWLGVSHWVGNYLIHYISVHVVLKYKDLWLSITKYYFKLSHQYSIVFCNKLKKKIVACQGGLSMKIVTFLPEKWFRTIKPISLQKQIAYQNIP